MKGYPSDSTRKKTWARHGAPTGDITNRITSEDMKERSTRKDGRWIYHNKKYGTLPGDGVPASNMTAWKQNGVPELQNNTCGFQKSAHGIQNRFNQLIPLISLIVLINLFLFIQVPKNICFALTRHLKSHKRPTSIQNETKSGLGQGPKTRGSAGKPNKGTVRNIRDLQGI